MGGARSPKGRMVEVVPEDESDILPSTPLGIGAGRTETGFGIRTGARASASRIGSLIS